LFHEFQTLFYEYAHSLTVIHQPPYTLVFIVKSKPTCHITRQASTNARASVRYPI